MRIDARTKKDLDTFHALRVKRTGESSVVVTLEPKAPTTNYGPEDWAELLTALESQKAEADRLRARVAQLEAASGWSPVENGWHYEGNGYWMSVSGNGDRQRISFGERDELTFGIVDLPANCKVCEHR